MKVVFFILVITTNICFAQHYWPMVCDNCSQSVRRINSNFGDYRDINRFHLGVDVQQTDSSMIYSVTDALVIRDPYYNGTYYTVTVQHGNWDEDNEEWSILFPDEYSVYLHLINLVPNITQGSVVLPNTAAIADGDLLHDNHLHFNLVEDLNGTYKNFNDDGAYNPLRRLWEDFNEVDQYDPTLHNLYFETEADVDVLNYPDNYDSRYFENDPMSSFTRILYENQPSDQHPKVMIRNIMSSDRLRMIIQATDRLNYGTWLTPHEISILLDEGSTTTSIPFYYQVIFSDIQPGRPAAEIVYNTAYPLATVYGTNEQYYRLYRHPTNTTTLPDPYQTVNDPINLYNASEGMHRVEISLKSEPWLDIDNQLIANTTTRYFYYYLLKNAGNFIDLAQSSS